MDDGIRSVHRLIFVFDADSGAINALIDSTRKLFRTKGCSLCTITHGMAGEKGEWRSSREQFEVPIDYLHRNEVAGEMARLVDGKLPCVLAQTAKGLEMVMEPAVLNRCGGDVAEFRGLLSHHLAMRRLSLS